jgi:hypothetical protein
MVVRMLPMLPLLLRIECAAATFFVLLLLPMRRLLMQLCGVNSCSCSFFPVSLGCA